MKLRFEKSIESCNPIEGKRIIDIGCGPGHYSIELANRGAQYVCGIDFAGEMVELAKQKAKSRKVEEKCNFIVADFLTFPITEKFDYSIVMGFMDYIAEPKEIIKKVLSITKSKAFFSFPVQKGLLAWQRRLRYKKRCDLFTYTIEQLRMLFSDENFRDINFEKIDRDYFVTVYM